LELGVIILLNKQKEVGIRKKKELLTSLIISSVGTRGVHRYRTGPDRPRLKTEIWASPGPRPGPDRSRTGLVSRNAKFRKLGQNTGTVWLCHKADRAAAKFWHGQTVPICTAMLPVPDSILISNYAFALCQRQLAKQFIQPY